MLFRSVSQSRYCFGLTLNSTGTTSLQGTIGGTTALTTLTANAGGTTQLGGDITTTGAQTFNDAIALATNVTIDAVTSNITFADTINGGFGLTLNSTGTTSLQGAIGGTTALTTLTANAGGTTQLGGDITTTGAQTFNDAIALTANVTADAGTANITFADTINGGFGLTLNSTGTTSLQGVGNRELGIRILGIWNLGIGSLESGISVSRIGLVS